MRCPDCNRFVSTEIEVTEVECDEVEDLGKNKGHAMITLHLAKNCSDCGTQLAEKQVEIEADVDLADFEPVA